MSAERFTDNGDGTVTDHECGLMWTREDTMNLMEKWVNYLEADDFARSLNDKKFAGFEDWRLPEKDELETLFDESFSTKDKFGKELKISPVFAPECGFSLIAKMVPGRNRTWVFNLRDGEYSQPDGVWTLSESARAVRTI